MVFKMSSQPVRCKRGRSQVRLNNNTLFYFSTRDVAKTAWVHFVKSKHPYAQFIAQYASQKHFL